MPVTDTQLRAYEDDGYLIVRGLFSADEIGTLGRAARADRQLEAQARHRADGEGGAAKLTVFNHPGDDIYGAFARSRRLVDVMAALVGEEVYHWHTKMNMKEARGGGAWAWHQDYGYWYDDGCLYPRLGSVMIAVDRATKANGCLQVLRGSHHIGRINHMKLADTGGQTGADLEHVEQAVKRHELVYVDMEPGDAVFFHGNTLHRSDQNKSDDPRWTLICCYNARSNSPYKPAKHPDYTPLDTLDDAAFTEAIHTYSTRVTEAATQ